LANCVLNQLRLAGVGPLIDATLEFPEPSGPGSNLYIFTGVNGSGKTTALEAIAQLFTLNSPGKLWSRLKSRFASEDAFVGFRFGCEEGFYRAHEREPGLVSAVRAENRHVLRAQDFFASFQRGECGDAFAKFLNDWPRFRWDDPGRTAFSTAAFAYSGRRSFESARLSAIQEISASPFEGALDFYRTNDSATLVQWVANSYAKSAMAAQDGAADEAAALRRSVIAVERAMTQLAEKSFNFYMRRNPLDVGVEYDGLRMPWSVLPDGIKSVVSWLSDLMMRLDRIRWSGEEAIWDRRFILILDEVDIHLHPKWQRKILPLLSELFPKAQIFVSTHSPFVVASVGSANVYTFHGSAQPVVQQHGTGGASITAILEAVFDVSEEFSAQAERLLEDFRRARERFLRDGNRDHHGQVVDLAKKISAMGPELQDIISAELAQISKLRPIEFGSSADDAV
jgi:predicted ATP-binding protein involved in virulence